MAVADDEFAYRGFTGTAERSGGEIRFIAETTPENALALRSALPWLKPSRFGHIPPPASATGSVGNTRSRAGAEDGRFGHQPGARSSRSGRWAARHRTARNVLDDATWGAFQAGWTRPVGGDADHLEELDDIDETVAAGFVFYTLDPKAEVDPEAEHADPAAIQQKVEALDWTGLDSDWRHA